MDASAILFGLVGTRTRGPEAHDGPDA